MTGILVDSNVVLDVATEDPAWGPWSAEALAAAANRYPLIINPLIYAEVSIRYPTIEEIDEVCPPHVFRRDPLPFEAAFLAGKAFLAYKGRGGSSTSPMPDFYIGAHAAIAGFQLLTRDPKRFRTSFPKLALIAPH